MARATSRPGLVAAALVGVLSSVRIWYLAARPELLITVVPDDAFYYLRLAHNRVAVELWSFDQHSVTSGFHVLYAYLLAAVEWLFGPVIENWLQGFMVISVLSTLCFMVAAYLVVRTGERLFGRAAAWWGLIVFTGSWTSQLTTMMMEAPLVALSAAVVLALTVDERTPSRIAGVALVAVGWVAALSRADFALLPGVLWLVLLVVARQEKPQLRRASLLLAGAVAGVVTTLLHSYVVTGHLAPSSALVKLQWSLRAGPDQLAPQLLLLAGIAAAFGFVSWHLGRRRSPALAFEPISLGCLITLLGYLFVFYVIGSRGVQPWYQVLFLAPLAILVMAAATFMSARLSRIAVAALVSLAVLTSVMAMIVPRWPWQTGMYHAAQKLAERPEIAYFGSWNAGIVAVVSGRQVTNLDGLVDDQAASAAAAGRLYEYLRERRIEYLVDDAGALSWTESGIVDPRIAECYRVVETLADPDDPPRPNGLTTLFQLRPECR